MIKEEISRSEHVEQKRNFFELETQRARYRIVYGHHRRESSADFLAGSDGVILEGICDYNKPGLALEALDSARHSEQYRKIVEGAKKRKIPIFLVDIIPYYLGKHTSYEGSLLYYSVVMAIESVFGISLIRSGVKEIRREKRLKGGISRRAFLGRAIKVLGGLYFSLPLIEMGTSAPEYFTRRGVYGDHTTYRRMQKGLRIVNDALHPELRSMILRGRDLLIAQKSDAVANYVREKIDRKPTIGIVVGSMHSGIERTLPMSDRERVEKLLEYFGDDLKRQGIIARLEYTDPNSDEVSCLLFSDLNLVDENDPIMNLYRLPGQRGTGQGDK